MWKIAKRKLPIGIQYEGSGDWFCLHHKFVDYLVNSKDEFLTYLKSFFKYSIFGPEVRKIHNFIGIFKSKKILHFENKSNFIILPCLIHRIVIIISTFH